MNVTISDGDLDTLDDQSLDRIDTGSQWPLLIY